MKYPISLLLFALGCGPAPLTFSDLRVEELTSARAVVRFTTSQPSSCEVQLGLAAYKLDTTYTDPGMTAGLLATLHAVPLENLQPDRTYFFRARAVTAAGSVFDSELGQLVTPPLTAAPLTNVALVSKGTRVVSVSSNFGGGAVDSAWGANRAIDGDFVTEWATNGDGDSARIELDLGQLRQLTAFGFRSRSMSDGSSIVTRVGLRLDGGPRLEFDTPDPNQLYVFQLAVAVDARSAVIEAIATTKGNTGAKEIQLLSP